MATIPVLDGHNDTLTQIRNAPEGERRSFLERSERGHIDLPRAREGGLAGGFFSIFTASRGYQRTPEPLLDEEGRAVPGGVHVPLPPRLRRSTATTYTLKVVSDAHRLAEAAPDEVAVVRTTAELGRCMGTGVFAIILHLEGAEAIDGALTTLDVLYQAGLRSLGPVWSRPNMFGHGVPFDFPRSPDTGPGLTRWGRALVRRCNELGIVVDVSHLNERGFWDVAELSDAPLVATHSNAHALCPSPRNLTDAQLDEIARTGGVVGLNFHVGFLRADGDGSGERPTSLTEIVRHARYIAHRIGVDHLALGSDFDGATMPTDLPDVSHLPRLLEALADAGFSRDEVARIAYLNWVRVLETTWRE